MRLGPALRRLLPGTELDALRRFEDRTDLEDLIRKLHAHLADLDGFISVAGEE